MSDRAVSGGAAAGADVPRPAAVYGGAGLIPFVACTVLVWVLPPGWANFALDVLLGYGAVILSFLGAVHWGLALADPGGARADAGWRRLGWSVTPALLAWVSLVLVPLGGLVLQVIGFTAAFFADLRAVRLGRVPAWYRRLRRPLTVVVLLCLAAAAVRVAVIG
ncbi:Protein of unknown function [Limimonas halophila]|uniref:DUF3429 domain-containing protein n=1 Tax=Limimonas halophila TaxID=1082479 RepID=A0A1G7T361_9PROT|nr:DUF3429 domain-containing protein [Limimonas halophila]SDG29756.1 Protein of unknown function [Limimonas halophila]